MNNTPTTAKIKIVVVTVGWGCHFLTNNKFNNP